MPNDHHARIVLRGERAEEGIGLAALGRVTSALAEALRAFGRIERGEAPRRTGTTSGRDEALTDLRLVGIEHGSIGLVLSEPPSATPEPHMLVAEHAAFANFDALVRGLREETLPDEVLGAFDRSLKALGKGASIGLKYQGPEAWIDRDGVSRMRRRSAVESPRPMRVVGRLRALDLDRTRIGLRTTEGMEWACEYPDEMDLAVIEAINHVVVAHGFGALTGPGRGRIEITDLRVVPEPKQTALFVLEPVSRDALIGSTARPALAALPSLFADDMGDDEVEAFFQAIRDA